MQLVNVKARIQTQVPTPWHDAHSLPENVFLTVKPGPVHTRVGRAGEGREWGFLGGKSAQQRMKCGGRLPPPVLEGPKAETPKLGAARPPPTGLVPSLPLPGDTLLVPHPLTATPLRTPPGQPE